MKLEFIYQYISLNQEVLKIIQILKKCPKACIIPILDIEDSLQIPLDPEKTAILKSRARITLKELLLQAKELDLKTGPCIRINATDTTEFRNDIHMLRELNELVSWKGIFLPKVHSADVLTEYIINLKGINYKELVVMAESRAFFTNYKDIIGLCKSEGICKIHFGHWDYFLDAREFPIPLPDDAKLWTRIDSLIKALEADRFHYIHTPFCYLLKHEDFQSIAAYLDSLTTLPFGMTTLSFSQAQAICRLENHVTPVNPVNYTFNTEKQVKIAEDLVAFFTRPVSPEYSFNIDTSNYQFYAPHEYLNALDFLKKMKRDGNR